jgi:SAM-dependent methyltransferase
MTPASCRICGSARATVAGSVEYLAGFPCTIVDCADCGCRATAELAAVHAALHVTPAISYYATYRVLFDEARALFARGDRAALDELLRRHPKYRFVLDRLAALPPRANVLEWGCSRGYLTAASLLAGRSALGVDVAAAAVAAARDAFGDAFVTADSPRIELAAPYDAIYHVGLIGCVPDPIGLTNRLLSLLKPGGALFFNSPNRDALHQRAQLWFDSAPPPELVTLFPERFWRTQMPGVEAAVTAAPVGASESTVKTLQRWFGPRWHPPTPHSTASPSAHRWTQPRPNVMWRTIEAAAAKLSAKTGLRLGNWPDEFGLYVVMSRP